MNTAMKSAQNATTVRFNDDYARRAVYEAAQLEGRSLSAFIVNAALERAERVIKRRKAMRSEVETIALSQKAWREFAAALNNPPEPSAALVKAMRKHMGAEEK